MVAEVYEGKSDELGDVQYLDVTETGETSADARKERTDGNEDITEEAPFALLNGEILDCRIDGPAKEKNECIEIEEWRKRPHPLPGEHSAAEARIEAWWNFDRRSENANGGYENDGGAKEG